MRRYSIKKNVNEYTKRVHFITLGCKVNQYETNAMITDFIKLGYSITENIDDAYIVIVNTCTVTNVADKKSRQMLKKAKEKNEKFVVCTGCMAEKKDLTLEYVDLILNNRGKLNIAKYVTEYLKEKNENTNYDLEYSIDDTLGYGEFNSDSYQDKKRAILKIQDGCNMFCTYCIIPYTRGRIRSRDKDNIINEAKNIAKQGIKEIVLTGIHLASYGKEKEKIAENYYLIDLLEDLNNIDGISRIRLGSIEPKLMSEEFLQRLIKLNKICPHFHLSLQSATNEILKKMNRKYTIEEFFEIISRIRKYYLDAMLTTDIIVGFPGETEELFKQTYDNLNKIRFFKLQVFPYSEREGTVATRFPNKVTREKKKERVKSLMRLSDEIQEEYLKQIILKSKTDTKNILEVLIEEEKNGKYFGHTANYIKVAIEKEKIENIFKNLMLKEEHKNKINAIDIAEKIIGNIYAVKPKEIIKEEKNINDYYILSDF